MAQAKPSTRFVKALPGTHELVVETALRYVSPGGRALDLGAGTGALAERLQRAGLQVNAADIDNYFELDSEFIQIDLNDPNFDRRLGSGFDLITSVEVIEHLENPTAYLRAIERLLKPGGVAILTTPNVENVAARIKYFLRGEIRAMDKTAPEHITPIHLDLFTRQVVPRTGLQLVEHFVHPKGDFPLTGRRYFVPLFWMVIPFVKGPALTGDCHVFVLKKRPVVRKAEA
ncbi:MAG TPA: methyltransferase domain-containing protein [Candidatus Acidoferrales bacterium]|nr:methyltransferase domain-containing protein [Candidatus Acidoferrales bacterium]